MKKTINAIFKKKLDEIYIVSPNNLGFKKLTDIYRLLTSYLKTAPFIIVVPFSFFITFFLYFIFGFLIVKLVNLLQYGF